RALRVVEAARKPPHDAIDHHHRRQLAAGGDVIADRDLAIDVLLHEALVDALVTARDDDEPLFFRELAHEVLAEPLALGRHHHHARPLDPRFALPRARRTNRGLQRLG